MVMPPGWHRKLIFFRHGFNRLPENHSSFAGEGATSEKRLPKKKRLPTPGCGGYRAKGKDFMPKNIQHTQTTIHHRSKGWEDT